MRESLTKAMKIWQDSTDLGRGESRDFIFELVTSWENIVRGMINRGEATFNDVLAPEVSHFRNQIHSHLLMLFSHIGLARAHCPTLHGLEGVRSIERDPLRHGRQYDVYTYSSVFRACATLLLPHVNSIQQVPL